MAKRLLVLPALLLLLPFTGRADTPPDLILQTEGRLLGSDGTPVTSVKPMTFALFRAPTGGTAAWSDDFQVSFDETGAYALALGDSTDGTHQALPGSLFTGAPLYLAVTVDGVELAPRLRVGEVPQARLAAHALTADNVDCEGCILPAALSGGITPDKLEVLTADKLPQIPGDKLDTVPLEKATGTLPVQSLPPVPTTDLTGSIAPAQVDDGSLPLSKLAASTCTDGQVPKWTAAANAWTCGNDNGGDFTAGAGISLSNGAISIATGGITGAMIGNAQISLDKIGGPCTNGQVLKRNGLVWACGTDDVGGGGSSGLTQVSVTSPLSGLGTSASPLSLADGGIVGAKIAVGAIDATKLAANVAPVFLQGTTTFVRTGPASWQGHGGAIHLGAKTISTDGKSGMCLVLVNAADGSSPDQATCYDWSSSDQVTATTDAISHATSGTVALLIGAANWYPGVKASPTAQAALASLGLHRAVHAALADPAPPGLVPGLAYVAAVTVGQGVAVEAVATSGARLGGWLTGGAFVGGGAQPTALVDPRTNAPALSSSGDGRLLVPGTNTVEFGAGDTKQADAGKIGYGTFTADTLDIVGGGTASTSRKVKIWAEGGLTVDGSADLSSYLYADGKDSGGNSIVARGGGIYAAGAITALGGITDVKDTIAFASNPGGGGGDGASLSFKRYANAEDSELLLQVANDDGDRIHLDAPGGTFDKCPNGFFTFSRGHLCMSTAIFPPATMDAALQRCSSLGAHVCTQAEFQVSCQWSGIGGTPASVNTLYSQADPEYPPGLTNLNMYGNVAVGWYGDKGPADDTFDTWNGPSCAANNDGGAVNRVTPLVYRCCF